MPHRGSVRGQSPICDKWGIAKTAREEKMRARDEKFRKAKEAENAKMMELYKKHVLKEPESNLVQINGIAPAAKPAEAREEIGALGD
jgi:7,8-dihydro-6-hydroxymethylpterin dimethyltransferase